ncbi:MAG: hypothetical protein C0407_08270 [Desulfobacca sp.]|nr:hypothetical protein [Desulfobacca sp.]
MGMKIEKPYRSIICFPWTAVVFLQLFLMFGFCSGLLRGEVRNIASRSDEVVISRSWFDIDHDGVKETVEIVMAKGERVNDQEPWCGNGEKWEGYFTVRIKKNGQILSGQSLNGLMFPSQREADPISFWTPEFVLVFADYNGDGQVDFNLGQYGSCNGNIYRLFTIDRNGRVSPLPIAGEEGIFISSDKRANSTDLIQAEKGIISIRYYDNSLGKTRTGRHRWDGRRFIPLMGR